MKEKPLNVNSLAFGPTKGKLRIIKLFYIKDIHGPAFENIKLFLWKPNTSNTLF